VTATARIALIPRDGLFCKDGRGWHTSASGRGHGLDWPWPSTVLGALRTAWGRAEEARSGTGFDRDAWRTRTANIALDRTLVLRRPHGAEWKGAYRVWPVPSDAIWLEGRAEVERLEPIPPALPTLGRDDDEAREALWRPRFADGAKPEPLPRWWSEAHFATWLSGRPVPSRDPENAFAMPRRVQVHVGIRPEELTASEGVLFSHDVMETLERRAEWAIGVEVSLPGGDLPSMATLGSDARLAALEPLPEALFEPPAPLLEAFRATSAGLRIVVVTPSCFEHSWLPDGFEPRHGEYRGRLAGVAGELVLRAAFVPRPVHISGWDMAAGMPKPTSRMVAPGAVYFFERADGALLDEEDARPLWLAAVGTRTNEGFGRVVPGVWNPARSDR
jgi:CRISPR-associated protein Cmr3